MGDPLSDFCKSPFWDANVVWNTTNPDLTECFQKTILVWIPCALLWLFTPIELYRLPSLTISSRHPWTGLTVAKVVFVFFLLTTSILDMTHWLLKYVKDVEDVPYPNFNSPFIKAATYLLAMMLLFIHKNRGKSSSAILFIFWLLMFISSTISYRTHLSNALDSVKRESLVDFVLSVISYPIIVSLLILSSFSDVKQPTKIANNNQPSPEIDSSFVSQIFFAWFDSLAIKGFRESLAIGDLWDLSPVNQSVNVVSDFDRHWKEIRGNFQKDKSKQQPSILTALWRTFRWPFMFAGVMRFIADMLSLVSPLILQLLIDFVSSPSEPTWKGYFYAALLCVSALIQSLLYGQHYWIMFNISMRVRSAIISAIYEKSLRINAMVKRTSTVGEIVNLMSVDAQRLMDLLPELHVMWSAVIQIGVAFYLLWNLLGPSILAGLGVMLLMVPLNGLIAGKFKLLQIKQMRAKDERVKLMNEVLNGIKVLKLYAWEKSFSDQINNLRGHELSVMKSGAYLNALASFVFNSVPLMVTLATFATFVLIDERNILDAQKAFVSLSLFGIIRLPLFFIPMMFIAAIQAGVSFKRMNKFLNSGELNSQTISHDQTAEHPITIKNATFAWASNDEPVLHDITLSIPEKSLVAVVGPVGCGKSSLISAILGEMEKCNGYINTKGSIAYVPQQAWIQNATLRDNILFGKPFNQTRYQEVIDACALGPDLEILPGGDQIEIGEKGINLSGGQKQRISLARAVYFDSEVVFLDDPLSAVDSHVGKHIFDHVIGPKGLLKNKTRIFVTNGITYLPQTDSIFVLYEGRIREEGTYHSLLDKKGHFAELVMTYLQEHDDDDLSEEAITDLEDLAQDFLSRLGTPELERQISRRLSARSASATPLTEESTSDFESSKKHLPPRLIRKTRKTSVASSKKVTVRSQMSTVARLIQVEAMETGNVNIAVYKQYFVSLGFSVAFVVAFAYTASAVFAVGSNFWLSIWSEDVTILVNQTQNTQLRDLRLGVYGGLGLAQSLAVLIASYALALGCINASRFFHSNMLHNVVRCPMSFFDTTPLGRILNRFSKDIDIVDTTIPMILRPLIGTFLQVASTIVVISISTPFFTLVIIPVGFCYYFLQRFYIASSRQLKRLESITRSPIFSHFSETLSGAGTVRAYGQVDKFIYLSQRKVDTNHICYYPSIIANRWLAVRLELLSNVISVSAALLAVIGRDTLDPGTVGLSLSYAVAVTQALIFMVRMTSDLETNIVAVERIKEYTQTETEAPWIEPHYGLPADWPDNGNINFQDYSTKYRKELDLVLRNLDLSIRGGEKIGIVGRTGAGKSSLTLGLFRIIEPSNGLITIDDVHTGKLGLHQLRSKLTIIPQDPILFSGTLHMNLDPFGKHSDAELWTALEHAHLKKFVRTLEDGLEHHISEGGENLSVGQRQLVCLARALLRKTKVLVLDEATAAVDLETDDLIQATIRKEFADCTIITIAHRLNTVMDSNRVIVLDQGTIKEFDSPTVLLQDKNSLFYSMAHDAGIV